MNSRPERTLLAVVLQLGGIAVTASAMQGAIVVRVISLMLGIAFLATSNHLLPPSPEKDPDSARQGAGTHARPLHHTHPAGVRRI